MFAIPVTCVCDVFPRELFPFGRGGRTFRKSDGQADGLGPHVMLACGWNRMTQERHENDTPRGEKGLPLIGLRIHSSNTLVEAANHGNHVLTYG